MFLGIYWSAISLSEDSTLRRDESRSTKDSKFFLKLSDAEVEKRIIDQVEGVKLSMTADTGVAPSISIEEARDYLSEVLKEIKRKEEDTVHYVSIFLQKRQLNTKLSI